MANYWDNKMAELEKEKKKKKKDSTTTAPSTDYWDNKMAELEAQESALDIAPVGQNTTTTQKSGGFWGALTGQKEQEKSGGWVSNWFSSVLAGKGNPNPLLGQVKENATHTDSLTKVTSAYEPSQEVGLSAYMLYSPDVKAEDKKTYYKSGKTMLADINSRITAGTQKQDDYDFDELIKNLGHFDKKKDAEARAKLPKDIVQAYDDMSHAASVMRQNGNSKGAQNTLANFYNVTLPGLKEKYAKQGSQSALNETELGQLSYDREVLMYGMYAYAKEAVKDSSLSDEEKEELNAFIKEFEEEYSTTQTSASALMDAFHQKKGKNYAEEALTSDKLIFGIGGDASMQGLAAFNKGITGTLDLLLGKPLQELGWENNPISSVADFYSDEYDKYANKTAKSIHEVGGGKGLEIFAQLTEGTVAALPNALLALMSGGTSLGASGGSLAANAAYSGSSLLGKAGLTVQSMAKNPQYWLSFAQTYSSDYEQAVEAGVDENVALYSSMLISLLNAGVEIGIDGGSGIQGLPKNVAEGGESAIRAWVKSSLEEGGEEILQGVINRAVNKVTGGDETVFDGQQMLEEGVMGTAVGAILGGGQTIVQSGLNAKNDAPSEAEQTVIDAEVNRLIEEAKAEGKEPTKKEIGEIEERVKKDLEKGYISTDRIEEILGGDEYTTYKTDYDKAVESEDAIVKEFDELANTPSGELSYVQQKRLNELESQVDDARNKTQSSQLRNQFMDGFSPRIQNSRLTESYNERARRGQAFEANVEEYDNEAAKQTLQNIIDGGAMNNTNRSHELVNLLTKISERTGAVVDVQTAEKLAEAGYGIEGATVNGFVKDGKITLNVNSNKMLNAVVGHEVTHVLENTEFYDALQESLFQYAQTKGEYQSRYDALAKLYEGKPGYETDFDSKIKKELTADLVGDYLFTDSQFIENLAAKKRNVFQKIYDEIKYMLKVATHGSKEYRELEAVKRNFDKVWDKVKNTKSSDTQFSLSDNTGKELSKGQQDYFKDSKIRDENGNLMVMYHGSRDAGFHTFDSRFSDDDTSFFFVDRNDVAASYSGTSEVYEARTFNTAEDMNNFFVEIGRSEYKVAEKDGEYTLHDDGGEVATSKSLAEIYEEFCEWEGVGYGSANYKVYLNLTNPLVVDADGRNWDKIDAEFSQEWYDKYNSLTAEEKAALIDLAEWEDFRLFNSEIQEAKDNALASAYAKLGEDCNIYDLFSVAADNFSEEAMRENARRYLKTRDYAQRAKEQGYDGVIFKNIVDNGGYSNGSEGASTVAIAFDSNQIKSTANTNPTEDADIRYSLTEYTAEEKKAHNDLAIERFGKTYSWAETGYLLLDGTRLDFSGKNDGGPRGHRTIDHREIRDAIGDDYGGDSYSGSLVQFMSEGNIRIIPEIAGINLSVQPTEAQEKALAGYVQMHRGEVVLDLDDTNGYTVASVEYPAGTRSSKVLADIRAYFENGTKPEMSNPYSLTKEGETAPTYGNYNISGKDVALETAPENVAPMQENVAPVQDAVQDAVQDDDFAPARYDDVNATAEESFAAITDEDAPPVREVYNDEIADTTALSNNALKGVAKSVSDALALNSKETKVVQEVVQKYSTTEMPSRDALSAELRDKFGERTWVERNEELADVKADIRKEPIAVSDHIKSEYPEWGAWMRKQFGKVKFRKDGLPVDTAYKELAEIHPDMFPADIVNEADQLNRIVEVANMDVNIDNSYELSDEDIYEAADIVIEEVGKYKEGLLQKNVEAESRNAFWDLRGVDPLADETTDIFDETVEAPAVEDKPIQTVPERLAAKLRNAETELAKNKQLRQESWVMFGEKIDSLKTEYNSKANKNTKAANDLLQKIENLRRRRADVDADYAKRVSDMEAKVETAREEVEAGDSPTVQREMRAELQGRKIDEMKAAFAEKGHDFDKVLSEAKSPSALKAADNTPQRLMDKTLGYEEGHILSDLTVNKVAEATTEATKWLNKITDRKNGLLAQLSKQYHIKPRSKESAAAQMYAEGFYENEKGEKVTYGDAELAQDFPNAKVQANIKGLASDPRIREFYDSTLAQINESRVRNGYPAIKPLDNYYLHFREQGDFFSKFGIPFNPNDVKAKDLPTDVNGMTADRKPGQPFFASAMHRKGWRTTHDILGGLERYAVSAAPQIYQIDNIQTLRALRNYIADGFGQAKGLEGIDEMDSKDIKDHIEKVFNNHLSNFASFLNEEANVIAGKTPLIDRGVEGIFGRKGLAILGSLNKQTGANQVGFNVSSSLTNVLPVIQTYAKLNPVDSVVGLAQFATNKIKSIAGKGDGFMETSPVAIRRKGADRFSRTAWDKAADAGYSLMGAVDNVATELIARSKYNELTRKGMDEQTAHKETDKWVSRLMGDRSVGQMPLAFNSKTLGVFLKYQLEVRNQLDSQFYDTIQEAKASTEDIQNGLERNAKKAAKITSTLFALAVGQHVFGQAFESVAGYNPAFDIISVISKALGLDDDEDDEDTALDNIGQAFKELLDDLPYTSTLTGGRIPISSMLPIAEMINGEDKYGNEKPWYETLGEAAPYYLLPTGYGQIKKTKAGLDMFSDEHPVAGSYTDSGNLRFPVEDNLWNKVQAGLFGQYASENAREYFDNDYAPLGENQIQEYKELDLPIRDYWEYREGLSGLKTNTEKFSYIEGLDLPIDKKSILAYNIATENKDISNAAEMVDLYGDLEIGENHASVGGVHYRWYEPDEGSEQKAGWRKLSKDELAKQNEVTSGLGITPEQYWGNKAEYDMQYKYPEKYAIIKEQGLTVEEYKEQYEDTAFIYTDPISQIADKPGKYAISKVISDDVFEYDAIKDEINAFKGDDRKDQIINYLNNSDLDYGQSIILYRTIYTSKEAKSMYNNDIVDYLNSRDDISWEEMKAILEELDFTVYDDGTIEW